MRHEILDFLKPGNKSELHSEQQGELENPFIKQQMLTCNSYLQVMWPPLASMTTSIQ